MTAPQQQPWDVLPILTVGDSDPSQICLAVGTALTHWEKVDQMHGHLFGTMVGSRIGAATVAYSSISSFFTRSNMVREVTYVILKDDEPLKGKTIELINLATKLSARRNEIAHGIISHFLGQSRDEQDKVTTVDEGHFLVPSMFAGKKKSDLYRAPGSSMTTIGTYAYTATQILMYSQHFVDLYNHLVKLVFDVDAYCQSKWPPSAPPQLTT